MNSTTQHPTLTCTQVYGVMEELITKIRQGKVVLWVGAGFSRYAGYPVAYELKKIILSSLSEEIEQCKDIDLSLSQSADIYEAKNGRAALIELLKQHYGSPPSRYETHKLLAAVDRFRYIITTNYDPLFEYGFGNDLVKITCDEDLPKIIENPIKPVLLKIHGDLLKPERIVITSHDYENFDSNTYLWSTIQSLSAQYSILFIGYSLEDEHVKREFQNLLSRLGEHKQTCYYISPRISAEKLELLEKNQVIHIKLDATVAIEEICQRIIQFSLIDGINNHNILTKSQNLFNNRGFITEVNYSGNHHKTISIKPIRQGVKSSLNLTLSSKSGKETMIREFRDVVIGKKFDPVTLKSSEISISVHDANIEGIFIIDPSIKGFNEITLTPSPVREILVDLFCPDIGKKLTSLPMKIYKSEYLAKLVVDDPDFTLEIEMDPEAKKGKIHLTYSALIKNVDRGEIIFGIFNSLFQGELVELIAEKMDKPFLLKTDQIRQSKDPVSIDNLFLLYTDLALIQNYFRIKLVVPEIITNNELEVIKELGDLIRGIQLPISDLTITIDNREDIQQLFFAKENPIIKISGCKKEISLFGSSICLPFLIIGNDVVIVNKSEIRDAINQKARELKFKIESQNGTLFIVIDQETRNNRSDFQVSNFPVLVKKSDTVL